MADKGDSKIAGPEAFNAHQTKLREQLDALIQERAPLLQPQGRQAYRVGPGDVLKIDVFGFPDISGDVTVSERGTITMPLIGTLEAAGKSVIELQAEVGTDLLKFVRMPKVRLSVSNYNAFQVSAVGAVMKPGYYPVKRVGYLVSDLIAEAGGIKDGASSRVYLIPAQTSSPASAAGAALGIDSSAAGPTSTKRAGVEIDLEELVGTLDKPPLQIPLMAGDTIVVPEAGQFRVDGEVERPGSFNITKRASTLGAVAAAGGFTYAADVNEVEVIRDIGAGKKASVTVDLEKVAFKGDPDVALRDGDVIIVPSSPSRFRARQVVEAFRSVLRGGVTTSVKYQ